MEVAKVIVVNASCFMLPARTDALANNERAAAALLTLFLIANKKHYLFRLIFMCRECEETYWGVV